MAQVAENGSSLNDPLFDGDYIDLTDETEPQDNPNGDEVLLVDATQPIRNISTVIQNAFQKKEDSGKKLNIQHVVTLAPKTTTSNLTITPKTTTNPNYGKQNGRHNVKQTQKPPTPKNVMLNNLLAVSPETTEQHKKHQNIDVSEVVLPRSPAEIWKNLFPPETSDHYTLSSDDDDVILVPSQSEGTSKLGAGLKPVSHPGTALPNATSTVNRASGPQKSTVGQGPSTAQKSSTSHVKSVSQGVAKGPSSTSHVKSVGQGPSTAQKSSTSHVKSVGQGVVKGPSSAQKSGTSNVRSVGQAVAKDPLKVTLRYLKPKPPNLKSVNQEVAKDPLEVAPTPQKSIASNLKSVGQAVAKEPPKLTPKPGKLEIVSRKEKIQLMHKLSAYKTPENNKSIVQTPFFRNKSSGAGLTPQKGIRNDQSASQVESSVSQIVIESVYSESTTETEYAELQPVLSDVSPQNVMQTQTNKRDFAEIKLVTKTTGKKDSEDDIICLFDDEPNEKTQTNQKSSETQTVQKLPTSDDAEKGNFLPESAIMNIIKQLTNGEKNVPFKILGNQVSSKPPKPQTLAEIVETASAVAGIPLNENSDTSNVPEEKKSVVFLLYPFDSGSGTAINPFKEGQVNQVIALVPANSNLANCSHLVANIGKQSNTPTPDVEIEAPALVTPVDISKIINEGKKPEVPGRCQYQQSKSQTFHLRGFTKREMSNPSCVREMKSLMRKEEKMIAIFKKTMARFESNFVYCGGETNYFLPEIVKTEIEEVFIEENVDSETERLPTISEVISKVNAEVRHMKKPRDDVKEKREAPQEALQLIKKGLELIQNWSQGVSGSQENTLDQKGDEPDKLRISTEKEPDVVQKRKRRRKRIDKGNEEEDNTEKVQVQKKPKRRKKQEIEQEEAHIKIINIEDLTGGKSDSQPVQRKRRGRKKKVDTNDDNDDLLLVKRIAIINQNGEIPKERRKWKKS